MEIIGIGYQATCVIFVSHGIINLIIKLMIYKLSAHKIKAKIGVKLNREFQLEIVCEWIL